MIYANFSYCFAAAAEKRDHRCGCNRHNLIKKQQLDTEIGRQPVFAIAMDQD